MTDPRCSFWFSGRGNFVFVLLQSIGVDVRAKTDVKTTQSENDTRVSVWERIYSAVMSINQSIDQSSDRSIDQSINQPINQFIN